MLGPNGAGKSTLLRMVATLLRPDAGEIAVCGPRLPERPATPAAPSDTSATTRSSTST